MKKERPSRWHSSGRPEGAPFPRENQGGGEKGREEEGDCAGEEGRDPDTRGEEGLGAQEGRPEAHAAEGGARGEGPDRDEGEGRWEGGERERGPGEALGAEGRGAARQGHVGRAWKGRGKRRRA